MRQTLHCYVMDMERKDVIITNDLKINSWHFYKYIKEGTAYSVMLESKDKESYATFHNTNGPDSISEKFLDNIISNPPIGFPLTKNLAVILKESFDMKIPIECSETCVCLAEYELTDKCRKIKSNKI